MIAYVSMFMFMLSIILIFSQKFHFLSVLLVLEIMTLSLFAMSVSLLGMGSGMTGSSFALVFLVFGVYEAANGLGLLVSRTRSSGMDQLSGLFTLVF
uniref:NADH-ubiquinone oxidoreductase chain 4L n=1 Tax=Sanguinolaria ovalis TaxID=2341032 RepID=A0A4P8L151_9BIVA|nr:NADH dehydrogenase subunit 4L [Sanguinolaria ovalis]QCQ20476.1 NADH dehydrogenase subunit 4L [Sanguinolaria ovalis]